VEANWTALKSFDVQLTSFESCLRPDDVLEQNRTLQRFTLSDDSGSFVYVRRTDQELIGLPSKEWKTFDAAIDAQARRSHRIEGKTEDEPIVRKSFGVYVAHFADGRLHILQHGGLPRSFEIESIAEARKKAECPDFSSLGFVRFPASNAKRYTTEELVLPSETVSVRNSTNTATISISKPSGKKSRYHQRWHLDLDRFAVQKYERLWGPVDLESSAKPIPLLVQRIEWEEQSGVFIPTKVLGQSAAAIRDENGKQFSYERMEECDLDWKRVNRVNKLTVDVRKLTQDEYVLDFVNGKYQ
jgi:hypothetical protein